MRRFCERARFPCPAAPRIAPLNRPAQAAAPLLGALPATRTRPSAATLKALRRAHGRQLPDYRLRTAAAQLLGYPRADDPPGARAPAAWKRLLKERDAALMPAVLKYNREVLVSLAALLACAGTNEKATHQFDIRISRHVASAQN